MPCPRLPASRTGQVLALDLASTAGFAVGGFDARPRFGAVQLRGEEVVHRMAALREWLDQQDEFQAVTAVVLEAAIIGDHSSIQAAEILTSLQAMARLWAFDMQLPLLTVASATVRKQVLGTARFPKGEAKKHVQAWARAQGYETASLDAADALCLWHAVQQATRGQAPAAPGMFVTPG